MGDEIDYEKLKKLQSRTKNTAKGAPRKKVVSKPSSSGSADMKIASALKKLGVQALPVTEEVNMFKDDGHVLHFSAPKVHAAVTSNTFAIYGNAQNKELTELVPGILNQLGPESLNSLKKLAESYQSMQQGQQGGPGATKADDDDDVPDLVESFEVADEPKKETSLEEVS